MQIATTIWDALYPKNVLGSIPNYHSIQESREEWFVEQQESLQQWQARGYCTNMQARASTWSRDQAIGAYPLLSRTLQHPVGSYWYRLRGLGFYR